MLPVCITCGHAYFYHRESREWQLLNTRRKKNLTGCTKHACTCASLVVPKT
jgi:hypothetical protein